MRQTPSRLFIIAVALLILGYNLHWMLGLWQQSVNGLTQDGQALGTDFISFWGAGWLSLQGMAEKAYHLPNLLQAQQVALPGYDELMPWHYPPILFALIAPFAILSYLPALALFSLLGLALGLSAQRAISRDWLWALLFIAAPATTFCLIQGQIGLFIAAVAVAGLLLLPTRPFIAGAILGLIACKPHFLPVFGLFLLYEHNWKALAGMMSCIGMLVLLSLILFGFAPWLAFINNISFAGSILTEGGVEWQKMGSTFVAARLLGFSAEWAWLAHTSFSFAALALTCRIWQQKNNDMSAAATLLCTLLLAPFQFDYDLVLLLGAIAFWIRGAQRAWLAGEETILALLWLAPRLCGVIAANTHLQTLPVILLGALLLLNQRTKVDRA